MTTATKRIHATDSTSSENFTIFPIHVTDGTVLHSKEEWDAWQAKRRNKRVGDAAPQRRVAVHDITQAGADAAEGYDPNATNQLTAAEYEAQARALEDANQANEAIQAWHRAAIAHSEAGNHAAAKACIVHAEHAAGNLDFSPALTRKGTAADGGDGEGEGEVFGGDDAGFAASEPYTIGDELSARDGSYQAREVPSAETFGDDDAPEVV
jgi:hypothetical protein